MPIRDEYRACLIAIARLRSCGPRAALLLIVRCDSEQAVTRVAAADVACGDWPHRVGALVRPWGITGGAASRGSFSGLLRLVGG